MGRRPPRQRRAERCVVPNSAVKKGGGVGVTGCGVCECDGVDVCVPIDGDIAVCLRREKEEGYEGRKKEERRKVIRG